MSDAIVKEDLVAKVSELGFSKHEALEKVEALLGEITTALAEHKNVKLSGFGNFNIKHKKARPGRNPKTGEAKEISARTVVTFHAGQTLKEILAESESA